ncbi:MAG: glycosyltransferase [Bacteroidales bacterium]|nr:glycosyltransferase [Bacteroidales bacterium]
MKKWIICSGTDWYRPSVTSTRQIIFQFKDKGYNILWVNPIAFKSPSINSDNLKSKNKKIINKLKTHLKLFKNPEKGIYVLIPFYFPVFKPGWDKLNARLIKLQMSLVAFFLGIRFSDSILWISGSFTLSPMLKKRFRSKVYQAADLISEFRTKDQGLLTKLKREEIYLSSNVDHLFASSSTIKAKLEKLSGREVTLLTHGVNFNHFNHDTRIHPRMQAIQSKGLPIAGYYGTLSDANDKLAFELLSQSGFSVVIIGKVLGDYSMLTQIENIYFLGPVNFSELPSYSRAFDVCLLNWVMADWIRNSYPVKTLEYLAMGKPVVSCRIPSVEELFGHLIYFVDSTEDYPAKAKQALEENNAESTLERIKAASLHTWESKFEIIENTIL